WKEFYETEVAPAALDELRQSPAIAELRRLCDPALAGSPHLTMRLANLAAAIDALATVEARACAALLADVREQAKVADSRVAKHWNDAADYEPMRLACEQVRKLIDKCPLNEAPDFSGAEEAARQGLALLRLVADVTESLKAAKRRRNQLEFDDLL